MTKPRTRSGAKSPAVLAMRERQKRATERRRADQAAGLAQNKLRQPQSRWQRFVRYVWDKKR